MLSQNVCNLIIRKLKLFYFAPRSFLYKETDKRTRSSDFPGIIVTGVIVDGFVGMGGGGGIGGIVGFGCPFVFNPACSRLYIVYHWLPGPNSEGSPPC
jgi:hypothetical protein